MYIPGARTTTIDQDKEQVMIRVGEDPTPAGGRGRGRSAENVKSLNAPALAKVLDMRGLRLYGISAAHKCCECLMHMTMKDHFK